VGVGSPVAIPSEPGPAGGSSRRHFPAARVDRGVRFVTSRPGAEYRRRARACLDAAHATQNGPMRAALLRLAEDWQRMAEGWDDPPRAAAEQAQEQQQVQPKARDKKEKPDNDEAAN
jgi:hypothetical protein